MNNAQEIDYRKSKRNSRIAWGFAIFFALFWLVVALVPFVFMIVNSFRKQFDMLSQGVFHFPDPWYFDNYPNIVKNGFFGYFGRSVLIVACSLVLMLAISACAAYPLSRMTFKSRGLIYAGIVAMMSIPMHVTLIPIFKMTNAMGLRDKLFALLHDDDPQGSGGIRRDRRLQQILQLLPDHPAAVQIRPVHTGHLQRRIDVE